MTTSTALYNVAKELEEKEVKKESKVIKYPTYKYIPPVYTYKGNLNKTQFPEFVNICKLSQKKLKQYLCGEMKKLYQENCFIGDGYIYCKGTIPVLLTAHMDTVHKDLIKDFYEDIQIDKEGKTTHTISSPQGIGGDDRCGVYIILEVLKAGYLPDILFCEDEEIGGIGSNKFCKTKFIDDVAELKFLIELDRANNNDIVFYDNGNIDWIDWVEDETNWKISYGSFSDICNLSPMSEISSVNLSCGYHKPHTLGEYVIVEEMLETIEIVKHLLDRSELVEQFIYEEKIRSYYGYGYNNYSKFNSRPYYDYDDDDEFDDYWYYNRNKSKKETCYKLEVMFLNSENEEEYVIIEGTSKADCWMNFFMEYNTIPYCDVLDCYLTNN